MQHLRIPDGSFRVTERVYFRITARVTEQGAIM